MYSSWISAIVTLALISDCYGQVREPKITRTVHARTSTNTQRTSGARGNTLKKRPVLQTPDPRSSIITKIDELHTAVETQRNVFVTHKRDFDNHISSIERRFSEMSSKMQFLLNKNIDLENQLKSINEKFVLVPKEKVQQNDGELGNNTVTQARSVSKSAVEDYLSNRGAELIEMMPPQKKAKVPQKSTSARSGNHKNYLVNNNSSNKQKPDYVSDALLRLFAQDKHTHDRLLTLEAKITAFDVAESVTTTIIVEACNETDSTTEILELKDMEKRVGDLEKKIEWNNINSPYDLKEEQTNKIGVIEARGSKRSKYKNEVYDARAAATEARKSLFSAARTTVFYGSDKNALNITFNHIYVNKGKHFLYNSTFVCHLDGFYFFTFTIRSRDGFFSYVTLMKNDEPQTSISADSDDRNIMQTQSTILKLSYDDKVWLRVGPNRKYGFDSEETNKYMTFSGFLIYKGS
ncbi:uncharacterized protein [Antedon mediterranea]|uniref:uncharacterized protein n=1 Tax=Antedon mediterranea TaxID=105859 RepID=UPI003AF96BFC